MRKNKYFNKIVLFLLLCTGVLFLSSNKALAGDLTDKSDTMTRLGNSSADWVFSDHDIQFTTETGVASTETIVITFPSDFNGTTDPDGNLDVNDVDFFEDTSPDGTCDGVEETLVAAAPGASEWSAVFSGTENRVLTLTSGGASATVDAGSEVCIKIGETATGGSANSQYANPTTSGAKTISLSVGSGADTGDIVVRIIDNDRVTITATVSETIAFTVDDNAIGFGDLSLSNARFATGDTVGADGPSSTSAHTMTIATNGSSGYSITYNGATLTFDANDIDAATISGDEDGSPGTEQFAIGFTTSDDATIASAYNQVNPNYNYSFVESTTTQVVSETVPTDTETISAFYLANISGTTPAGAYSTSLTYVASANF